MLVSGLDYCESNPKVRLDKFCKATLGRPARVILKAATATLPFKANGKAGIFYHPRRQHNGQQLLLPKAQTMHDMTQDHPTDSDLGFDKDNPRIVSKRARLIRHLAIDELPQINLLPELSMVGPRSQHEDFFDYFIGQVSKIDRGLADAYDALYHYEGVRHGLTGPGQLRMAQTNKRSPAVMADAMRLDLDYYLDRATLPGDVAIIATTPIYLIAGSFIRHFEQAAQESIAA